MEVATIAKIWGTRSPFRVMWTRVDDIRGGFYRTLTAHHIRSSVDPAGSIAGWEHAVAGDSFVTGTSMEGTGVKDGMDNMMIEGAKELPYEIPNRRLGAHILKTGVPTLWWYSVGHTPTAYAVETILDELLELGGKEPVQGWIELMGNHPRELGLLKKVAQMASWNGAKIGNGHARGVAVHKSFRSYVAQIVEVSKGADGMPIVHNVWCAVDCGIAVLRSKPGHHSRSNGRRHRLWS